MGNYEPIIITDMKKSKMTSTATEYYKKSEQDEPKMPFLILNAKEAISFLHRRFKKHYDLVKRRDSKYNII